MKTEETIWIVPEYYPDFKCKADRCRHTCCNGWRIPISFREYTRLIGMPCRRRLRERIDVAFCQPPEVSEERYALISHDWMGNCHLLENGLCMLYTEDRLDYLPRICDLYPRSLRQIGDQQLACCSSACEKVVEMLMEADSLNMKKVSLASEPVIRMDAGAVSLKLVMKFQQMLKDRSLPLAQRIRNICLQVNEEQFTADYHNSADPLHLVIDILNRLTERQSYLYEIVELLAERYETSPQLYEQDREAFESRFPDWMAIFENVINNSMLYESFPFVDDRFDDTEAYRGLCATYGLMRVVCIGYSVSHPERSDLVDAIAALFHLIEHTPFYYNSNVIVRNGAVLLKL
ncbi:MAG: flagellin lysine-N-methylase [Erysipelotrichaceae bacterium]|nr:flagellin lysine-N-methylase [Erysipelotrichaceae bacterium]